MDAQKHARTMKKLVPVLFVWGMVGSGMGIAEEPTILKILPGEGRPSAIILGSGELQNTQVEMPTNGELIVASGVQDGILPPRPETPKVERGRWQTTLNGSGVAKDPAVESWLGAVAQLQPKRPASGSPKPDESPARVENVVRAEREMTTPPRAVPVREPSLAYNEPEPSSPSPVADVSLRLELNEVALLRDAASRAGGKLEWTMKLVGVKAEDLLVPLAQSGQVRVFQDPSKPGRWVIASLTKDDREAKIREEIARLEARRRDLLEQVKSLEALSGRSGGMR